MGTVGITQKHVSSVWCETAVGFVQFSSVTKWCSSLCNAWCADLGANGADPAADICVKKWHLHGGKSWFQCFLLINHLTFCNSAHDARAWSQMMQTLRLSTFSARLMCAHDLVMCAHDVWCAPTICSNVRPRCTAMCVHDRVILAWPSQGMRCKTSALVLLYPKCRLEGSVGGCGGVKSDIPPVVGLIAPERAKEGRRRRQLPSNRHLRCTFAPMCSLYWFTGYYPQPKC